MLLYPWGSREAQALLLSSSYLTAHVRIAVMLLYHLELYLQVLTVLLSHRDRQMR
jgi:hypothetical protein